MPILVQAFPDESSKMGIATRRDAVCGKLAICNVLRQAGVPYTLTADFAASPKSKAFAEDISRFAALCRIVKSLKSFNVGVLGARTTPFKTVRIDEIAFQKRGVNVETLDLSQVFKLMREAGEDEIAVKRKDIEDQHASVHDLYVTDVVLKILDLGR